MVMVEFISNSPSSNTSGAIEYIHNATLSSADMKFRAGAAVHMFILGNAAT